MGYTEVNNIAEAKVGQSLASSAADHIIAKSQYVYDTNLKGYQSEINENHEDSIHRIYTVINEIKGTFGYETFDTGNSYAIGDKVIYNGILYKFTQAHSAGAWNAAHVEAEPVSDEINRLKTYVDSIVDTGYLYLGLATPSTTAPTVTTKAFYLASTAGTYTNLGGVVLADGELAVIKYNGSTWSKDSIDTDNSVKVVEQTLTPEQKSIARENIGASPVVNISKNTQTGGYDISVGGGTSTNVAGQADTKSLVDGHIYGKLHLIGNGNTLTSGTSIPIIGGRKYRVTILNWDMTGVTSNANYDKLNIHEKYSDGTGAILVNLVMSNTIAPYYDIVTSSNAVALYLGGRGAHGVDNVVAVEDITLYLDASYDRLYEKLYITGSGSTFVSSKGIGRLLSVIPGRTYKITPLIWDTENTGSTSTNVMFGFYFYDSSKALISGSHNAEITRTELPLASSYIRTAPSNAAFLSISGRVAEGTEGVVLVEDFAVERKLYEQDDALDVLNGVDVVLTEDNNYHGANHYKWNNQLLANDSMIGKSLDEVNTYSNVGIRNYIIPVSGYNKITFLQYSSTSNYGSLILDSDMRVLNVVSTDSVSNLEIYIPDNAAYFIFSHLKGTTASNRKVVLTKYVVPELEVEQSKLRNRLDGTPYDVQFNRYSVPLLGQIKADSSVMGKSIDEVTHITSLNYSNFLIPIDGWKKIRFYQYRSSNQYGSLFLNEDKVVVGYKSMSSINIVSMDIPNGAKYFLYSVSLSSISSKFVELSGAIDFQSEIDFLSSRIDNISVSGIYSSTGLSPVLRQGYLADTGALVEDAHYVTTDIINGAFLLELNDGYKVYYASMFDRQGHLLSDHYFRNNVATGLYSSRYMITDAKGNEEVGYKVVIRKDDDSEVSASDNIIKRLVILKDAGLHRYIPDDLPNYDKALMRINAIENVMWTALAKVPAYYSTDASINDDYYRTGNRFYGIPYSDVADIRKYVPQNVSFRTFISAAHNKRSLLYTEDVSAAHSHSEYGNTYHGSHCRPYFGAVCSSLTGFVMGLRRIYLSTNYHNNTVPNLSTVANPTADTLRPLDLYWKEGHITIISDIYKDEFGKVVFIVLAEQSLPYGYRTIYTPEEFFARIERNDGEIHRYSGWDGLTFDEDIRDYIKCGLGDVQQSPKFNDDICTFAGDYATFEASDKIFLNCRRANTYTSVNIYKDGDSTPVRTIDITSLPADTLYDDGEDWVMVDLTGLLTYGKYTAVLTDGTNTTEPTHWEVIALEFSATREGNDVIFTIGCDGGTLECIDKTKSDGFPSSWHYITSEEASAGACTISWEYSSTYKYLHLIAKGDYGTVQKKIDMPE